MDMFTLSAMIVFGLLATSVLQVAQH